MTKKQYLLFSLLTTLPLFAIGQGLALIPNSEKGTYYSSTNFDLEDKNAVYIFDNIIKNNSKKTVKYSWVKTELDKPTAWEISISDDTDTYAPNVHRNPKDLILRAKKQAPLAIHIQANGEAGCGLIQLALVDKKSPDIVYAFEIFEVHIMPPEVIEYIPEVTVSELSIYPNPISKSFSITKNRLVDYIILYNIVGKKVATFEHDNGAYYNIEQLPDGIYLVSLVSKTNGTLKTIRVSKRSIRP